MDFYSEASSRPFAHGQISWNAAELKYGQLSNEKNPQKYQMRYKTIIKI